MTMTLDFDPAAILAERQAGASWQTLAKRLGLPETTLRARMNRFTGYRQVPRGDRSAAANKAWATRRAQALPVAVDRQPEIQGVTVLREVAPPASRLPELAEAIFDRPADDAGQLSDKYRPRWLTEVLGQPAAVDSLRAFLRAPTPTAMLFTGDSGCGKTSAAHALARELGVAVDEKEIGGMLEIASGSQTADSVRGMVQLLRYRPLIGSGWRVLIVNECDRMALPAETIWLDALENLPPTTVIIFTTNDPTRLSRRFRDRCEAIPFASEGEALRPWIRAMAQRIWAREVGHGECPDVDSLGTPTMGEADDMHVSFRLALKQLQQRIRLKGV